jgi:hypothetical protein
MADRNRQEHERSLDIFTSFWQVDDYEVFGKTDQTDARELSEDN